MSAKQHIKPYCPTIVVLPRNEQYPRGAELGLSFFIQQDGSIDERATSTPGRRDDRCRLAEPEGRSLRRSTADVQSLPHGLGRPKRLICSPQWDKTNHPITGKRSGEFSCSTAYILHASISILLSHSYTFFIFRLSFTIPYTIPSSLFQLVVQVTSYNEFSKIKKVLPVESYLLAQ